MSRSVSVRILLLALLAGGFAHPAPAQSPANEHDHAVMPPAPAIPGESLYQLEMQLTTADGRSHALAELRGQPVLVTMFYASCQGVCPLLAFTMRRMEADLSAAQRPQLRMLLVSFDPARDDAGALAGFARLNRLDPARAWVARASDSQVRELAAALGVRYRDVGNGVFSHSAVIALLDEDGAIVARTSTLNTLDPDFMKALRATLARAPPAP